MNLHRALITFLLVVVCVGCGPGIRFRPGEIPVPTATDPEFVQAGHQLHQHVITNQAVLHDPTAERRVSRILGKLLNVTPSLGHWTVTLLDDPRVNAMTAPGNYIYVYRGLLEQLRNDDEVAAILAHEIAHRLAQHELKTSEQQWGEALVMVATIAAGAAVASQRGATHQDVADIMDATGALGAGFTTLRYEKDQEREADQIGMFLVADAGINPMAFADVWAGLISAEGAGGSDFFSTHPLHEDRYAMAVRLLPVAQTRYQTALKKSSKAKRAAMRPQLSPTVAAQISQAQGALANDDLPTASSIAHSLIAQAPASPEVYNLLGHVKALSGDTKKAYTAFRKGLTLAPEDSTLLYNIGCMHARKGEHRAALQSLEKAFMRNPDLVAHAQEDSDLSSLRKNPEFQRLVNQHYTVPAPENVGGNTFRVN